MLATESCHFRSRHGMTNQNWCGDPHGIDNLENIVRQTLIGVTCLGVARRAESPSSHTVDVAGATQSLSKIIKNVCRIAGARKQHDVPPRPAPVENLQTDAILHRYELHKVRRRVLPSRGLALSESKQRAG